VTLSLSSLCASSAHHLFCFSLWNAELLCFLRVPCSWDSVAVRTKRGVCSCATSMASSMAHSAAALLHASTTSTTPRNCSAVARGARRGGTSAHIWSPPPPTTKSTRAAAASSLQAGSAIQKLTTTTTASGLVQASARSQGKDLLSNGCSL
jgi:hypothetical protein